MRRFFREIEDGQELLIHFSRYSKLQREKKEMVNYKESSLGILSGTQEKILRKGTHISNCTSLVFTRVPKNAIFEVDL